MDELPDEAAISAVTLAELHFGVLVARSDDSKRQRLWRLTEVEARLAALPVDEMVARSYGALAHAVASTGRQPRVRTMDILIAATAHAYEVPVFTHNRDYFNVFQELMEVRFV